MAVAEPEFCCLSLYLICIDPFASSCNMSIHVNLVGHVVEWIATLRSDHLLEIVYRLLSSPNSLVLTLYLLSSACKRLNTLINPSVFHTCPQVIQLAFTFHVFFSVKKDWHSSEKSLTSSEKRLRPKWKKTETQLKITETQMKKDWDSNEKRLTLKWKSLRLNWKKDWHSSENSSRRAQ